MHLLKRESVSLLTRLRTSIRFFFSATPQKDSYDFTNKLEQCRCKESIRKLHAKIIIYGQEQNILLAAKLINKYSNSGMADARKVFDNLLQRDVFLWNTMIQGYATSGPYEKAMEIYYTMRCIGVSANCYTFPFLIKACAAMKDYDLGRIVHADVVKSGFEFDLYVGNALVTFYTKRQEFDASLKVFDQIRKKDVVSWNSVISGYAANKHSFEALALFHEMLKDDSAPAPDRATLVAILPACAQISAVKEGLWAHAYIIKTGNKTDAALGCGLISFYANCGRLKAARNVFSQMSDKNIMVWNAIIKGYGMHGNLDKALKLFSDMIETGLKPDGMIFVCLLSACSHNGMVSEGLELFKKMQDFGVEKTKEHYACIVDLLGRAGLISKAIEFIKTMPIEPGADVYGALLGACRIHNNIEIAEQVAEKLFVLDPYNAGRRLIMIKMYEDAGRVEDAAKQRKLMREKKIKKPIGCSSVEVDSVFHTFGVEDESHPLTAQIFDTIERLDLVVQDELIAI